MNILNGILMTWVTGIAVLTWTAAGEDFKWAPVTSADWSIHADSAKGIRSAVIIFEKLIEDDQDLLNNECYLTLYRRIKIFNTEGRTWGDVTVPPMSSAQKVEEIRGRTVPPGGAEIPLQESQVREKEIFQSEGLRVRQKSFSMPGITDGCILEYYIKYRLPSPPFIWLIQKDIVVLRGEFHWKFYRGQGVNTLQNDLVRNEYTPKYLWLNTRDPGTVEQLPNSTEPVEVRFTISDVPAFEDEPLSLSEYALLTQLRMYYGRAAAPGLFWGNVSQDLTISLENYTKDHDKAREIIATFGAAESLDAKITAAYSWVQGNLKNTSYDQSGRKFDLNKSVNDVLEHRYGNITDINLTFYDMLKQMNIDAKMAYVLDRTEGLLVTDIKHWQFDGSVAAVKDAQGKYRFYSPGNQYLSRTHVPWFYEGTLALLVGDQSQQFILVSYTSPEVNSEHRMLELRLGDDLKLAGKMKEQHTGHGARRLRFLAVGVSAKDLQEKLRKELLEEYPNAEFDSISSGGFSDQAAPVTFDCGIRFSDAQSRLGNRLLIKPFGAFAQADNPFTAETRENPILFNYAFDLLESTTITIPDSYAVEALPPDTVFSNKAGRCEMKASTYERTISLQRSFRLNSPFWLAASYDIVRQLFRMRATLDGTTIVLKKP
jgi:hypothetical protein